MQKRSKRSIKTDRAKLSRQPWELEHVAKKFGCKVSLVRLARKTVMDLAATRAGQNRRLVEAALLKLLK